MGPLQRSGLHRWLAAMSMVVRRLSRPPGTETVTALFDTDHVSRTRVRPRIGLNEHVTRAPQPPVVRPEPQP